VRLLQKLWTLSHTFLTFWSIFTTCLTFARWNLHPKSLTANIHEFTYRNPAFGKMVHTISQQIIQRYSREFAESWVTDSQNYHDLRFFKVEFSLEQNSILSSKWKRMKYIFELHSKHLKFIIKILIKQIGAVKKMVVNQLKKIAKFIWRNSCSIVRWWLACTRWWITIFIYALKKFTCRSWINFFIKLG